MDEHCGLGAPWESTRRSVALADVIEPPPVRYVQNEDVHISYQVVGEGERDVVLVQGYLSHLDMDWEHPAMARFFRAVASFNRLILFDKRGTGLSDRAVGIATLEERMDDVRAVMDGAGSDRPVLVC